MGPVVLKFKWVCEKTEYEVQSKNIRVLEQSYTFFSEQSFFFGGIALDLQLGPDGNQVTMKCKLFIMNWKLPDLPSYKVRGIQVEIVYKWVHLSRSLELKFHVLMAHLPSIPGHATLPRLQYQQVYFCK